MRKTLAVAVLALWALIGLPGTAHAGGPTSVLITEPSTGQSTALYHTSGAYADLERMLADDAQSTTSTEPPGIGGASYNLTWMIHDVQPWRLDSVHIATDGTAYVATTFVSDPGDISHSQAWREVERPQALAALLDRAFSGDGSQVSAPQPVADADPVTAPAAPAAAETRWFSLTGWRWVVPGGLGGLLVGLLVTRLRVPGAMPGEPRRVLVDGQPEPTSRTRVSARSAMQARR